MSAPFPNRAPAGAGCRGWSPLFFPRSHAPYLLLDRAQSHRPQVATHDHAFPAPRHCSPTPPTPDPRRPRGWTAPVLCGAWRCVQPIPSFQPSPRSGRHERMRMCPNSLWVGARSAPGRCRCQSPRARPHYPPRQYLSALSTRAVLDFLTHTLTHTHTRTPHHALTPSSSYPALYARTAPARACVRVRGSRTPPPHLPVGAPSRSLQHEVHARRRLWPPAAAAAAAAAAALWDHHVH